MKPTLADSQPPDRADASSDLIDISGLRLADLRGLADSVVTRSLRRILKEMEGPQDAVAGFQSSI
jgi:FXSXX-COOH protein